MTCVPPAHRNRHRRHRSSRTVAVAASLLLTILALLLTIPAVLLAAPPAGAASLPAVPGARAVVGDFASTLSFRISKIAPAVITRDGPDLMIVSGTITNTGSDPVTDLDLRLQRGDVLDGSEAIAAEIASPSQPAAVITASAPLPGALQPGAEMPFNAFAPITGSSPASLQIDAPGVYPVMLNINGDIQATDQTVHARVGELHLLATVLSVPGIAPTARPPAIAQPTTPAPLQVSMLWPLVDKPHLGVGGVFLDDELATSIRPGGRLSGLLDLLAVDDPGGRAVTLVLDPMLLDELQRMSVGYRVTARPGVPQPALTPAPATPTTAARSTPRSGTPAGPGAATATTPAAPNPSSAAAAPFAVPTAGTVTGTGQEAARAFLHRLRLLALQYPVALLPYSNPDVLALTHDRSADRVTSLTDIGRAIARRVIGPTKPAPGAGLVTTLALPPDGVADATTLAALTAAGFTSAVLTGDSVHGVQHPVGAADARLAGGKTLPLAIADSDLLPDAAAVSATADNAEQLNTLAARMVGEYLDPSGVPIVFLPPASWTAATAPGMQQLSGLLRTLFAGGAAVGVGPAVIASTGTASATVRPSDDAAAPLAPGYLHDVQAARDRMARMRRAVKTDTGSGPTAPNPAALFGALNESLLRAYSSALRADPRPGDSILSTVDATLSSMQQGVSIRSSGQSYTLASSSSPLLVTVQNSLPYAVTVSVVISGGQQAGLRVTQPAAQTIPAGRSQQFRIQSEVSRAGSFTVLATLVGPGGAPWRPPSALSVTSSAYGTVTIVVIVLAGCVLLFMVVIRVRQRLKGTPDPDSESAAETDEPIVAEWGDPEPAAVAVGAGGPGPDPAGAPPVPTDLGPR